MRNDGDRPGIDFDGARRTMVGDGRTDTQRIDMVRGRSDRSPALRDVHRGFVGLAATE